MSGPCTMLLTPHPEDTEDRQCGKPAVYVYRNDPEHTICSECYDSLQDDPDIQTEYEAR